MKTKIKNIVLVSLGIVLIVIGFMTPGLWPYQLPFCFIGGFMIGRFIPLSIISFKKEKKIEKPTQYDWIKHIENNK
jgi:hypothetical protein